MVKKLSKEEGLKKGQNSQSKNALPDNVFTVFFKKGEQKIVCVIPKKVSKKAVDRNRMRRLIKESLTGQNFTNQLVIVVRNNFASLKLSEVQPSLIQMVKKLS